MSQPEAPALARQAAANGVAGPKLFLATPLHDGRVHHGYMMGVVQLLAAAPERVIVSQFTSSLLPANREKLTLGFLESDATHLLFVDSDIGWGAADAERLLRANRDFVTGVYAKKQADEAPEATFLGARDGALLEVAQTGMAFALLTRACLEALIAGHPELRYDTPVGSGIGLWTTRFNGQYYSEDASFCARFRALGGRIWAHSEVVVTRHGDRPYLPRGFEPLPRGSR